MPGALRAIRYGQPKLPRRAVAVLPVMWKGLQKNADGLYKFADVANRFEEALAAYDAIPR